MATVPALFTLVKGELKDLGNLAPLTPMPPQNELTEEESVEWSRLLYVQYDLAVFYSLEQGAASYQFRLEAIVEIERRQPELKERALAMVRGFNDQLKVQKWLKKYQRVAEDVEKLHLAKAS
jgi:hypothetical protein